MQLGSDVVCVDGAPLVRTSRVGQRPGDAVVRRLRDLLRKQRRLMKTLAHRALGTTLGVWVALLGCNPCHAAELPAAKQAIFLARVIAYDANLKSRAGSTVNIAILAKKGDGESEKMADAVMKAFAPLEAAIVLGLPVKISRASFTSRDALDRSIREAGIDTLYVCSGLDGNLGDIKAVARARKVLTMASQEGHLKQGLSLGVFSIDGKNTILVNLDASREEGVVFGFELLRLVTVVR